MQNVCKLHLPNCSCIRSVMCFSSFTSGNLILQTKVKKKHFAKLSFDHRVLKHHILVCKCSRRQFYSVLKLVLFYAKLWESWHLLLQIHTLSLHIKKINILNVPCHTRNPSAKCSSRLMPLNRFQKFKFNSLEEICGSEVLQYLG